MTTFLLDIWHDLREKRLWPVAVALVIGMVAIPIVVVKPAAAPPANTAPPGPTTAALPTVASDATIVDGSNLDTFDIKDPFQSKADAPGSDLPGAGGDAGGAGSAPGSANGPGAGGTDASSGGTGGGMAGGSGGGSGGSGDGSDDGKRYYTYTVNLRFGARGKARAYEGVQSLDLLPDDENPVVSFMGMKDDAKTAVFFIVDPAFQADGEGECAPSPEDCRFVYLGVDDGRDEETLSAADGNVEYVLQLDKINIKHLSESEAEGDAQPQPDSDTTPARKRQSRNDHNLVTVPLASRR
jgi:hypothetical protein